MKGVIIIDDCCVFEPSEERKAKAEKMFNDLMDSIRRDIDSSNTPIIQITSHVVEQQE